MVTYYKSPVMPPLTYVGCFDNSSPNRIQRLDLDGIYEFDVASCLLDAQLNNLPGFGMEHPAGIAQDGYAECVRLNPVPPTMNRMPDADCETEMLNGFRLGGAYRVAVYKLMDTSVASTGPCKASGNCACSSNYDESCSSYSGTYNNNEECTVTFSPSAVLTSSAFSTESGYDKLTVNGRVSKYSGSTGPHDVAASSMTWSSDLSNLKPFSGWKICQQSYSPPSGFLNLHYEQAYSSVNRYGTTKFAWTKLKWLNPYLLQIDASDITYATWPSGSDLTSSILPYTVASGQGCAGGGSTTGEGLIDLRGTPYVIAGVSDTPCYQTSSGTTTSTCFQWEASGWKAAVSVTCSHGNQRCVIRCGGNCGTCKPMNNILQLAWA